MNSLPRELIMNKFPACDGHNFKQFWLYLVLLICFSSKFGSNILVTKNLGLISILSSVDFFSKN